MDFLLYGALLLAQAGTGVKQFAMKHCGRLTPGPFNSVCINMARSLICLAVSVIIWLWTDGVGTNLFGHVIIVIAGIGTAFNLFTWILASQLVPLIMIESVSMIGSMLIPMILAPYLYDGDTVSLLQWMGCALVIASVFLFAKKEKKTVQKGSALQKIVVLAVNAVSATLLSIFKKYYTYHITAKGLGTIEYFTLINFLTVLIVFLLLFAVYYTLEKKKATAAVGIAEEAKVELPYRKVWVYILLAAVSLYVNELFTSYAMQLPSSIYYPLSRGLNVGCTFLLDVIIFKDKITSRKIVGFLFVIAAVILINL